MCLQKDRYMKIVAILLKSGSFAAYFILVSKYLWKMPFHLRNVFHHYLQSRTCRKASGKSTLFLQSYTPGGGVLFGAIMLIMLLPFLLYKCELGFFTIIAGVQARGAQLCEQTCNLTLSAKGPRLYYWALHAGILADVQLAVVRGIVTLYCMLAVCTFYNWRLVFLIHPPESDDRRDTLSAWQAHEKEYGEHLKDVRAVFQAGRLGSLLRVVFFHDYVACALAVRDFCLHKEGLHQPAANLWPVLTQVLMTKVLANAVAAVSEANDLADVLERKLSKVDGMSDAEENLLFKQIRRLRQHAVGLKFGKFGTMPFDDHFVWSATHALVIVVGFIQ
ncbi:uncharacterized protein LOC129582947 [Paramacrobiotus metropolitanus]|uniref:uncharacterized protein LOC129582947 n=1 Tax=Paramacrobiotus metropolitanus TaxID=2943436 RepID=UPI00244588C9|nr:uncharacterized protein LOC129582947 [Paramacrobiotus metropolitanus]